MENQNSKTNPRLVASIVILVILLVGALGFGGWAYKEMLRYKKDTDKIVNQAVTKAKEDQKLELQADFAQREKSPYRVFKGPATYGTITFSYPKTWSGYVDQTSTSQPINGYFHPGVVPSVSPSGSGTLPGFALRLELLNTDYAQQLKQMETQISQGAVKARAYVPPRMSKTANVQPGVLLEGAITQDQQGIMLIIKVRDKTLQISTGSTNYLNDFKNIILRSLTFAP